MLVTRISLRTLRLLPTLSNNFARKKDKKDNDEEDSPSTDSPKNAILE